LVQIYRIISAMYFDVVVYLITFVAVIAGFHSGFLRSAVTIPPPSRSVSRKTPLDERADPGSAASTA
jgi:uncharacterized membrane protein YagU involved in acid resistance